jgi:hypothetical protein
MLPRSQSREKEESMTIDFSTLNPEDIVQSIQQLVEGSQLALLKVWQTAKCHMQKCPPDSSSTTPQPLSILHASVYQDQTVYLRNVHPFLVYAGLS